MADTGGHGFDEDLVGTGVVDVDVFDGQRFVDFAKYCCVGHVSSPFVLLVAISRLRGLRCRLLGGRVLGLSVDGA